MKIKKDEERGKKEGKEEEGKKKAFCKVKRERLDGRFLEGREEKMG